MAAICCPPTKMSFFANVGPASTHSFRSIRAHFRQDRRAALCPLRTRTFIPSGVCQIPEHPRRPFSRSSKQLPQRMLFKERLMPSLPHNPHSYASGLRSYLESALPDSRLTEASVAASYDPLLLLRTDHVLGHLRFPMAMFARAIKRSTRASKATTSNRRDNGIVSTSRLSSASDPSSLISTTFAPPSKRMSISAASLWSRWHHLWVHHWHAFRFSPLRR